VTTNKTGARTCGRPAASFARSLPTRGRRVKGADRLPAALGIACGGGAGWFRAMRGPDALEVIAANPLAYVLAAVICHRARFSGTFNRYGLALGEALLGDHQSYGMTERQYRTAKHQLAKWRFATFKATTKGTVARLMDSRLFSVFRLDTDGQNDGQATDGRRLSRAEDRKNRGLKKKIASRNSPAEAGTGDRSLRGQPSPAEVEKFRAEHRIDRECVADWREFCQRTGWENIGHWQKALSSYWRKWSSLRKRFPRPQSKRELFETTTDERLMP
jgi:hypothetical protein